jgi:hypothetical protein
LFSRRAKSSPTLRERISADKRGPGPYHLGATSASYQSAAEVIERRAPFCGHCGTPVILERFAGRDFDPNTGRLRELYVVVCPHFGKEANPDAGHTCYYAAYCAD